MSAADAAAAAADSASGDREAAMRAHYARQRLVPAIVLDKAAEAAEWYKKALRATHVTLHHMDGDAANRVMHASMEVYGSIVFFADEFPEWSPPDAPRTTGTAQALGKSPITLHLCMSTPDDVDDAFNHAVAAGATVGQPVDDQFWGDRYGTIVDPHGVTWHMGAPIDEARTKAANDKWQAQLAAASPAKRARSDDDK